jgi:hypothetical protein
MPRRQKVKQISWDDIVMECRNISPRYTNEIAEVIYSADGASRAIILKRRDGNFEIDFECLYPYDEDELYHLKPQFHGFWHPMLSGKSIIDTIEHAKKILQEEVWPS